MLSRRQFISRAGAAGALVLAPQTALEALAAPRGAAARLLRGGRFRQGVLSGDPTPRGITLLTVLDDVTGSGSVRLEVARDRDFRRVVARKTIATSGGRGYSVKARVGGLAPDERYYYRFETRDRNSPVGRFQTALPARLQSAREVRVLLVRRVLARLLQRVRGDGARRRRLRRLPRRLRVRRGVPLGRGRHGRARRHDRRAEPAEPGHRERGAVARRLPRQVRALPLRQGAARPARQVPDGGDLGRPRGAGQLRRPGTGRRPGPVQALVGRAQGRGLQGVLRGDALLRRGRRPRLPLRAARAQRRPDHARPAPVPGRPAVRGRGGAAVRRSGTSRARSWAPPRCAGSSAASAGPRPAGR